MKRKQFMMAVLLLCTMLTYAQMKPKSLYQPLKVGDKVPEYVLKNLINYPTATARLSDFKSQLLILDFWSTYCSSCVASWPKLLKLQQEFVGKIKIILINDTQQESIVKALLETQKRVRKVDMTLPIVCKDDLIKQLFPFQSYPHVVWIDQSGIVQSMTNGGYINETNIKEYLAHQKPEMEQKTDQEIVVKIGKPLFVNGNGGNGEQIIEQSVLSGHVPGMMSTCDISANETNGHYIYISSTTIGGMIRYAFSNRTDEMGSLTEMPASDLKFDVADSSLYADKINGEANIKNYYNYQYITKQGTQQELQLKFQQDLKRIFKLDIEWKVIKRKCLVLKAKDTALIAYKTGPWAFQTKDTGIRMNQEHIKNLIARVANQYYYDCPYPFVDETGLRGKTGNIEFEADMTDYRSVSKALKKYKMDLCLEDREVETLVITGQQKMK